MKLNKNCQQGTYVLPACLDEITLNKKNTEKFRVYNLMNPYQDYNIIFDNRSLKEKRCTYKINKFIKRS